MRFRPLVLSAVATVLAACSGGGGTAPPPTTNANCSAPATVTLSVGQHQVVNPATSGGCIRLPVPGGSGAQYLVAVISGAGQVTQTGVSGPYAFRVGAAGSLTSAQASVPAPIPATAAPAQRQEVGPPLRFHQMLRERERELAADVGNRLPATRSAAQLVPPTVGSERQFKVCKNLKCDQFDSVTAVARVVDQKTAIYLDKVVPTFDTLTQADLEDLARTFNSYHYPIDVNAFGGESDKDGNGVVIILLTDAVNALTPNCTDGRILGYFYGGDLLDIANSNKGEVFYAMVPAPATSTCTAAGRKATLDRLKPTLIHEFQHMISFNQHVLVRSSTVGETTWLNEGLSHYAESLGGRLIPNSECVGFTSCRSQYTSGDLFNAWDYLAKTDTTFLVVPSTSNGTLTERGASWLFVQWLADQFGTDSVGSNVTRSLVQTGLNGAANVVTVTGQDFPISIGEWLLAVYTDDLPGFTPQSLRLTYKSWGYRKVFSDNCCVSGAPFATPFPFEPVPVQSAGFPFLQAGTLRGGSGLHFRVVQDAASPAFDVLLSRTANGPAIDAALESRIAIVRLR
jgi:hypothetical protein